MPYAWKVSAKLYWCLNCNVPLIAPQCGLCGSKAVKAHGSPPRDFRPAFNYDMRILKETIEKELGAKACKVIVPSDVVLLNKIPYVDQANEVIVDGWVMGNLYYNPERGEWRFRPSYEGAARLAIEGAASCVEVDNERVKLWEVLSRSDFKGEVPLTEGRYVVLTNSRQMSIGVAVTLGGGKIKVIKSWDSHKPHIRGVKPTWSDVVEANKQYIDAEVERCTAFLINAAKSPDVFVSFSGGKDSLASLLIALRALGNKPMLFNDTGIEAPATVEHVWNVANKFGLELILASAEDAFWRSLPTYGPPARDYRWCCKVCKLVPIARTIKERFKGTVYAILGQRKYESFARLKASAIEKSRWIPNLVGLSPIRDWSALHVWLYLMVERVESNPLYKEGFDRIGCWLCPACELAEFKRIKEVYPDLWLSWEERALAWCKERGLPEDWFKLGLWRWRRLPGDARKFASRIGIDVKELEKKFRGLREVEVTVFTKPCENIYEAHGSVKAPLNLTRLSMMLQCIGGRVTFNENLGLIALRADEGFASISSNRTFSIRAGSSEDLTRLIEIVVKSLLRAKFCNTCGSCRNWCSTDSIVIDGGVKILDSCEGCRTCINACPIATYMYKSSTTIRGDLGVEG
ncbi:MAG: phosphoadenosine phosphosulfate reductase family protein [Candidatus Nezhaarchaeota archaeon]|nr:phosphoadenosine phosphosulfate reductase family protein [Candidatus Nezhaarchaeota archaeon]MCX8142286.1 phosphoadenosine phosphosulfate reductase family protein [Candidatus Nezhaarchaeota archaeon]MDW8050741.1 phosphoadenosine phosphosulfate reductase family protein [Nitrososphaerota archaeon]